MKKIVSVFLATILCLCFGPALARDFYTGKNFRVTGVWSGNELRAERVQLREPATDPKRGQIVASISALDVKARTLKSGPLIIEWDDQTEFKGLTAAKLAVGVPVRLSVATLGGTRLLATSVQQPSSPLSKDTVQLTGVASLMQPRSDGTKVFTLFGASIVMPQAGYNAVESLTRRQDTRRPEQPFRVPLFGRPLTITGAYDGTFHERRNFELDGAEKRSDFDHEFKVELFYPLRERIYLFAEIQAQYEAELRNTGNDLNSDKSLERGQMWVFFDRLAGSGFGLQLGRQNLREKREWWWDTDLDAARLYYDNGPFHAELGAGQELARVSTLQKNIAPEQNRVARLMAMGSWQWASKQTIEVFALRQQDRSRTEIEGARLDEIDQDPSDARLTWLGLRAIGERSLDTYGDLIYWADAAWVRGRESLLQFDTDDNRISTVGERQDVKVRGTAFDVGVSWRTPLPWQPAFTLGYAQASGDDSLKDGVDSAFRQTGLHNNKWRFFGVNRFRYYGELFRPELSNLNVVTAAVGFQFLKNSSVELLYHRYRQTKVADSMRDVRIDADLTGESRALGHEFDLVFGFREWAHLDLSVALATFKAGSAYGSFAGKRANSLLFELTYNF